MKDPYFILLADCIGRCFTPPVFGDTYAKRREFVKSNLIDLFCDCSENFEASKLREKILEYNS